MLIKDEGLTSIGVNDEMMPLTPEEKPSMCCLFAPVLGVFNAPRFGQGNWLIRPMDNKGTVAFVDSFATSGAMFSDTTAGISFTIR